VNRTKLLVALTVTVLVAGAAYEVAAHSTSDRGVPVVAAEGVPISTSVPDSTSSTTSTTTGESHKVTTTTTSTSEVHEPTTVPTSSTTEPHETTSTTIKATTSTTAPAGSLHLACATPAPNSAPSSVVCEWNDPPPGTTRWVLMREQTGPSQPLWETDDLGARRHVDDSAQAGVSYAYRISAYDGETFIATSNPVRLVAGGEG